LPIAGKRERLALAAIVWVALCGEPLPAGAATLPDSAWVMDHVRFLSDPICEGRGVGTEGLRVAAEYVEKEFRELGLAPAGADGSYRQRVEVVTGVQVEEPTDLRVHDHVYRVEEHFQPLGFSASGEIEEQVVFAGYGIHAPEYDYNDYADLDVRDKLVLVLQYEPGEMDPHSRFEGDVNTAYSELRTKAITARERGALGMLVVTGPRYHGDSDDLVATAPDAGYMSSGIVAAHVKREVANALLEGSGWTLERLQEFIDVHQMPKSFSLESTARVRISLSKQRAYVENIVGILRGADTTRAIVVGAHYDHLGRTSQHSLDPDATDTFHFGADDNASGTAALLAMARAWTSRPEPPQHSIIFAAFAAEELGLLGSARYVSDPPVPMEGTFAMLNFDMVGRVRDRKLVVMGTGTAAEFQDLVTETAAPYDFQLSLTQDGYGPSDHTSFYKEKVPVLALFSGVHLDYHKPTDTWDKLNGRGLAEVATFGYALSESLDARGQLEYVQTASSTQFRGIGGGAGYGAYLGTIPDYTQEEGGVKLAGVREGGPAEQGGIRGGDVVVAFDGVRIDNIYDYTYALRTRKPGQSVAIDVLREGERITFQVTLGKRGRSH
jgi:aminopeptidase YwaD